MDFQPLHEWPKNERDAKEIQKKFRDSIITVNSIDKPSLIAAVDTDFNDNNQRLYASVVLATYPGLKDLERTVAELDAAFPYIPSLLAFREGPVILKALARLKNRPDLIMFAGHGIAHPARFGMASHMGLITDIPSIGCARKILSGTYEPPDKARGSLSTLYMNNVKCGYVLRTRDEVKPIFISPGHKISLETSLEIVKSCLTGYRIPEPLRSAHLYAGKFKRSTAKKRSSAK